MKKESGITLATLTIYIVAFTIVMALLGNILAYFNSNISNIGDNSISSEEFNKFNTEFVADVKQCDAAEIRTSSNGNVRIILSNGINYNYIESDHSIYKNYVKIAKNIVKFSANIPSPTDNNNKNVIIVTIGTGVNTKKPNFGKTIKYVLKYW